MYGDPELIPRCRVIPDPGNCDSYYAFHGNISQVTSNHSPDGKISVMCLQKASWSEGNQTLLTYYQAPALIFGATEYTTSIDICLTAIVSWRKCSRRELVEIIKVLGTPTREEIRCMNPNYTDFRFPQIKAHPWHKVFHERVPAEAIDLTSRLLQYSSSLRCAALEACAHPFFNELRESNARLPNGRPLPPLFNFEPEHLAGISPELINHLIPEHIRRQTGFAHPG